MNFEYLDESSHGFLGDVFFVHVDPGMLNKSDLFDFYYRAMWFPGYFGFNWDAMYDFLCDLSWIKRRRIIIIHDRLPGMDEIDLGKYLSVLKDVCASWNGESHPRHDINIYLNFADIDIIERLIG